MRIGVTSACRYVNVPLNPPVKCGFLFEKTIKTRLQTGTKRKIKEALTPQRMVC